MRGRYERERRTDETTDGVAQLTRVKLVTLAAAFVWLSSVVMMRLALTLVPKEPVQWLVLQGVLMACPLWVAIACIHWVTAVRIGGPIHSSPRALRMVFGIDIVLAVASGVQIGLGCAAWLLRHRGA